MSERGINSPVIRKAITVVVLLVVTSVFLAVYYFTYLPQERANYNLRTFRILHEIAQNFKARFENYGTLYSNNYVSQKNKDQPLRASSLNTKDSNNFKKVFLASFKGNALSNDSFVSDNVIENDAVHYHVHKKIMTGKDLQTIIKTTSPGKKKLPANNDLDTTIKKTLAEIIEPCISPHFDVFESVLLIKQTAAGKKDSVPGDAILYESDKLNIANINTDSLFKDKNIESPDIKDISIEGVDYKMYLLPFKVKYNNGTFVLAGIVPYDSYRAQSQDLPVSMLLTLCFVLVSVLLALPFLKIFFLSKEESITINDVRAIITVIFIIPFFVTVICSGIWIWLYNEQHTNQALSTLQDNVEHNFYKELSDEILQAKEYDNVIGHPYTYAIKRMNEFDTSFTSRYNAHSLQKDTTDIKDIIFYPAYYKNLINLHWMNDVGNDVASWTFSRQLPPTYFKLADRDYFREIKYDMGYKLPDSLSFGVKDSFGLQPVLSRLTGEYSLNIAIQSKLLSAQNKKAVLGMSAKMYSVYNTIIPSGFSYCIIDKNGNILCHSDTARNLQENIFEECSDSFALKSIINHKDVITTSDLSLYEQPVQMKVKPLPNLPFCLVTYYDTRGNYLFIFHILAFVFICEAMLLLFVSLFSYFMMLSGKKNSKLFYSHAALTWLRPSSEKKNYYIKNAMQLIACIMLILICSLFFHNDEYYLYWLNAGLLLPLFAVTGYYIIKKSGTFFAQKPEKDFFTKPHFVKFIASISNILYLYFLSAIVFAILQNVLFFNKHCGSQTFLKTVLWAIIIAVPFMVSIIAGLNTKSKFFQKLNGTSYLTQFIISILLATIIISVVPTIIFTSYAFHEEKTLRMQSLQIDLAKKIQDRRNYVNKSLWQTKLSLFKDSAKAYTDSLKFKKNKGIYLPGNKDKLEILTRFKDSARINADCSPFYKHVTRYLFLPPDHDEFYDGATHSSYYYWVINKGDTKNTRSLDLHYGNSTDNKTKNAFSLTCITDDEYLFSRLTNNYAGLLILLALVILIVAFFKIIYSVCTRIFLIGFFEEINGKAGDKPEKALQLQSRINPQILENIKSVLGTKKAITFNLIREMENKRVNDDEDADGFIIELDLALLDVYESLWLNCNDVQKFTLYDYATDGFTNYKKVLVLYQLFKAGLLIKEDDGNITLFTRSFRNFLITKEAQPEIIRLINQGKKGSWSSLRTIFYVILIAVAIFIFISQDEASKRLITIVTSLGALLPAMLKLFDRSTSGNSSSSVKSSN